MAHQLGNSDIHGSFPFLPELSDTFKHSLQYLAIYHQNLQVLKIITQINEAHLPSTEKQEGGPEFKRVQEDSYWYKLSRIPTENRLYLGLVFCFVPLGLHHAPKALLSFFQMEIEFYTSALKNT